MKLAAKIAIALAILSMSSFAYARSWRVELDGSGDFTDIQMAEDAAAPGDTIRIGPGRFSTFHSLAVPESTEDAIVEVMKDNLTFIGSGRETTFLGPSSISSASDCQSVVFCSLGGFDAAIRNLTVENVRIGVMWKRGALEVLSCTFRSHDPKFVALFLLADRGLVMDCAFVLPHGGTAVGVLNVLSNMKGLDIENCTVDGAQYGIRVGHAARNVNIRSCAINQNSCGIVFDHGSTGAVCRSRVSRSQDCSLLVTNESAVTVIESEFDGGRQGIAVSDGGAVAARKIVVSNTTETAIYLSSRGMVRIHESDFVAADGLAVCCYPFGGSPKTIDLSGNYWGTTDLAAIRATILDSRCDLGNPFTVLCVPIANGATSPESSTWRASKVPDR